MVATSTAAAGVHEFTVEHVRALVDPTDAQAVALALVSGIVPFRADGGGLNDAMDWFGRSLVPLNAGLRALGNQSQYRQFQSTVQSLDTRTNQVPVCMLDLLRIKHTNAARNHFADGGSTLFGTATLNTSTQPSSVRLSFDGTAASSGQLHATFTAANASHPSPAITALTRTLRPRGTLDELRHAVELSGTTNPDHNVPTLRMLSAGRPGDRSDHNYTSCMRFAQYAPDDHDVWTIRHGQRTGDDLVYDALVSSLSGTAYYRVFESWPTDPFERV